MTGDQDYTIKPGGVIPVNNIDDPVSVWYDEGIIKKLEATQKEWNRIQNVYVDNVSTGNVVNWIKYDEEIVMDHTDRTICKHWFDMFLKNHPEWKFVINHEDPFYKKGGFKVTNGKHTMSHSYPSSDIHITPKLSRMAEQGETTQLYMDSSLGLEFTVASMKSFIAWAMGIEPLPKELQ